MIEVAGTGPWARALLLEGIALGVLAWATAVPAGASVLHGAASPDARAIPAFARAFRTACSTCHTAAPKLNVLGEAFRLNGYEMPQSELLQRSDDPVPLGAEPWKDAWPRAIWPGQLPGALPLALRIQTDLRVTRDPDANGAVTYDFPHELYLLAGGSLGSGVSTFLEMEWSPNGGLEVAQAKVRFANVVRGLPSGALNLSVGFLNPFLLTFTDRQIDRAGRQKLSWQSFRLSDVSFSPSDATVELGSPDATVMGEGTPSLEVDGLVGSRLHWGLGLAQGGSDGFVDRNGSKDPYYRLRVKLGGMDYRGGYGPNDGPVTGSGGQLLDRSVTLEHFGHFGSESTPEMPSGRHRALGWAARALYGTLDVGAGHARRTYRRPFGTQQGNVTAHSWFAKAELLVLPWAIASVKYDHLEVEADQAALPAGFTAPSADRHVLMPGLILLARQNVRVVVEGELLLSSDARVSGVRRRPHDLWIRLDLAF